MALIDENIFDLGLLYSAPEFQAELNQSARLKELKTRIREIDSLLSSVLDAMTNILADFVRFRIQMRTKSAKIFVIASKTLDSKCAQM